MAFTNDFEDNKNILDTILSLNEEQLGDFMSFLEKEGNGSYVNQAIQSVFDNLGEENNYILLEQLDGCIEDFKKLAENASPNKKRFYEDVFINTMNGTKERIENGAMLKNMKVQIEKMYPDAIIPTYAHNDDACADLYAHETVTIGPGMKKVVKTGIAVAIPHGYEGQVRLRSGVSLKTPLILANGVGTIDSGYRDEVGIILANISNVPYTVEKGTRLAQLKISPTYKAEWIEVDDITKIGSNRNGGYGSTGK